MIQNGLVEWIVGTLKREKEILAQTSYEYLIALLRNLALRTEGKKRCEEIPGLIRMFIDLLDS